MLHNWQDPSDVDPQDGLNTVEIRRSGTPLSLAAALALFSWVRHAVVQSRRRFFVGWPTSRGVECNTAIMLLDVVVDIQI